MNVNLARSQVVFNVWGSLKVPEASKSSCVHVSVFLDVFVPPRNRVFISHLFELQSTVATLALFCGCVRYRRKLTSCKHVITSLCLSRSVSLDCDLPRVSQLSHSTLLSDTGRWRYWSLSALTTGRIKSHRVVLLGESLFVMGKISQWLFFPCSQNHEGIFFFDSSLWWTS